MAAVGKCRNCGKTVYPLEAVTAIEKCWHKGCFKCDTCGWQLTLTSYKSWEQGIYCKTHFPVTGFGEKHVSGGEDLTGMTYKSPREAPKTTPVVSNVLIDAKPPSTGLGDFNTKTALNAPKMDVAGGVKRGDPKFVSPRGQGK